MGRAAVAWRRWSVVWKCCWSSGKHSHTSRRTQTRSARYWFTPFQLQEDRMNTSEIRSDLCMVFYSVLSEFQAHFKKWHRCVLLSLIINFALIYWNCDVKCEMFFPSCFTNFVPRVSLPQRGREGEVPWKWCWCLTVMIFSVCTTEQVLLLSVLVLGYHAIMFFIHFSGHK